MHDVPTCQHTRTSHTIRACTPAPGQGQQATCCTQDRIFNQPAPKQLSRCAMMNPSCAVSSRTRTAGFAQAATRVLPRKEGTHSSTVCSCQSWHHAPPHAHPGSQVCWLCLAPSLPTFFGPGPVAAAQAAKCGGRFIAMLRQAPAADVRMLSMVLQLLRWLIHRLAAHLEMDHAAAAPAQHELRGLLQRYAGAVEGTEDPGPDLESFERGASEALGADAFDLPPRPTSSSSTPVCPRWPTIVHVTQGCILRGAGRFHAHSSCSAFTTGTSQAVQLPPAAAQVTGLLACSKCFRG
jgi:hypothetical protein